MVYPKKTPNSEIFRGKRIFCYIFISDESLLWYLKCTPASLSSFTVQVNTEKDLGKRTHVGNTPELESIPNKAVGMPWVTVI